MAQLIRKRKKQSLKKPLIEDEIDGELGLAEEGLDQPQDLILRFPARIGQEDNRRAEEESGNKREEDPQTRIIDIRQG